MAAAVSPAATGATRNSYGQTEFFAVTTKRSENKWMICDIQFACTRIMNRQLSQPEGGLAVTRACAALPLQACGLMERPSRLQHAASLVLVS